MLIRRGLLALPSAVDARPSPQVCVASLVVLVWSAGFLGFAHELSFGECDGSTCFSCDAYRTSIEPTLIQQSPALVALFENLGILETEALSTLASRLMLPLRGPPAAEPVAPLPRD